MEAVVSLDSPWLGAAVFFYPFEKVFSVSSAIFTSFEDFVMKYMSSIHSHGTYFIIKNVIV